MQQRPADAFHFLFCKSAFTQIAFTRNMRKNTTAPELWSKAKGFADELTNRNVIEKNLTKQNQISKEHVKNNKAVRAILLQRGFKPESLPPAEDVMKLERRLENDDKKAAKGSKK